MAVAVLTAVPWDTGQNVSHVLFCLSPVKTKLCSRVGYRQKAGVGTAKVGREVGRQAW